MAHPKVMKMGYRDPKTFCIYPCIDNQKPIKGQPCMTTDWKTVEPEQNEWCCTGSVHIGPGEPFVCGCECHALPQEGEKP